MFITFESSVNDLIDSFCYAILKRSKYLDLMKTGVVPVKVVKMFVCGAPAAGKTTLKNSLTKVCFFIYSFI